MKRIPFNIPSLLIENQIGILLVSFNIKNENLWVYFASCYYNYFTFLHVIIDTYYDGGYKEPDRSFFNLTDLL